MGNAQSVYKKEWKYDALPPRKGNSPQNGLDQEPRLSSFSRPSGFRFIGDNLVEFEYSRVTIKKAMILSLSKPKYPAIHEHDFALLSFWGRSYSKSGVYKLSEWIKQQPWYLDTFVVSLTCSNVVEIVGVLLQGKRVGKRTRLAKIGTFTLAMNEAFVATWPEVKDLHWKVV